MDYQTANSNMIPSHDGSIDTDKQTKQEQTNNNEEKIFKMKSDIANDWTLIYSDSNSSVFDSSNSEQEFNNNNYMLNQLSVEEKPILSLLLDKNTDTVDCNTSEDDNSKITQNDDTTNNERNFVPNQFKNRRNSEESSSSSSVIVLNEDDHSQLFKNFIINKNNDFDDDSNKSFDYNEWRNLRNNINESDPERSSIDGPERSMSSSITSKSSDANVDSDENDEVFFRNVLNVNKDTDKPLLYDQFHLSQRFLLIDKKRQQKHKRFKIFKTKEHCGRVCQLTMKSTSPPPPPPSFADDAFLMDNNDLKNKQEYITSKNSDDDEHVNNIDDHDHDLDTSSPLNDQDSLVSLSLSLSSVLSGASSSNLSHLREKYLKSNDVIYKNVGFYSIDPAVDRRCFDSFGIRSNLENDNEDDDNADGSNSLRQLNYDDFPLIAQRGSRIRAYFHQPNTVLNNKLNLVLILSLTAVIGLGIGNFLGWSNQWNQHKQLSLTQVMKLKQLQDDLLICMNNQQYGTTSNLNTIHKVCVNNSDYWTERFRSLFDENQGLKELFQKTQKHFAENRPGTILGDDECANKNISDEFHNLKLDLLIKQMEHLKLLEVLEDIKIKGEHNEKRVRILEEENEDLKKKLEEEEYDDHVMAANYNSRVAKLEEENQELRVAFQNDESEDDQLITELYSKISFLTTDNKRFQQLLDHLEKQILFNEEVFEENDTEESDEHTIPRKELHSTSNESLKRYNLVRQRVNQLMAENEELKSKIALYRWTDPSNKIDDIIDSRLYDSKQMEQMKIRVTILHRQLLLAQENNRQLHKQNQYLLEQNKRLTRKMKHYHRQTMRKLRQKNERKVPDVGTEKNANENYGMKIWSSFMDQMRKNYNRLSKKLQDITSNHRETSINTATKKLLNYGSEFIQSTLDRMQIISEKLLDSKKGKNKESNTKENALLNYFSQRLNDFSKLVENSFQVTMNEMKSIMTPSSESGSSWFNNDDGQHSTNNRIIKIWSSFMDQMRKNYNRLSKKLQDITSNHRETSLNTATKKLLNYGSEFIQSTLDRMQIISEKLLDSKKDKNKESNTKENALLNYFSQRLDDFSKLVENSFQATMNEMKSIITPSSSESGSSWSNNHGGQHSTNNYRTKKILIKPEDEKSEEFYAPINSQEAETVDIKKMKKQLKNIRKKFQKLNHISNDWLIDRGELREKARMLKQVTDEELSDGDWLIQRGKAREKSRTDHVEETG